MANIKSAKKRATQAVKRGIQNLRRRRAVKGASQEIMKAISEKKSVEEIKKIHAEANKAFDKAAKSNRAIHRNKAARLKSQVAKLINRAGMRGK